MEVTDTIRSFADENGAILGSSAAVLLGYLLLGDWMLNRGVIGAEGHFAGATIAFIGASVLAAATAIIFTERMRQ